MSAWYFGCTNGIGHFLHGPEGRSIDRPEGFPWTQHPDGGLTPGRRNERGRRVDYLTKPPQSDAALHIKDGWTVLSMHDYSVDSRGNSNAAFIFDREIAEADVLDAASEAWPREFARITAAAPINIVERHVDGGSA